LRSSKITALLLSSKVDWTFDSETAYVCALTFIDTSRSTEGNKALQEFKIIKCVNVYMACIGCS